jgi:DNA-binding MarR family transcriptional regulator
MLVEHGPMRLGGLVDRLFLDKSTTSRVVGSLVKKGYVEQRPEADEGRATALHVTTSGKRLYRRITDDLVEQQKQLLHDLDPEVREAVVKVIRGLTRAADARFRSGVSVGPGGACCAPDGNGNQCE